MGRRLTAALLVVGILCCSASVSAAPGPVSIESYAVSLEGVAAAVEAGAGREAVPPPVAVETPAGILTVDLGWIGQELGATPTAADRRALAERLRNQAAQARIVSVAGKPGLDARLRQADADRESLQRILAGAGYGKAAVPSWWSRLWRSMGQWLSDGWRAISRALENLIGSPSGRWARISGWIAALVALGAGLFLVMHSLKRRRKPVGTPPPDAAVANRPGIPRDLRVRALALERSGQRREAIKLLLQAVLRRLEERRLIAMRPPLTNGTYVRQLTRSQPGAAPALAELAGLHDVKVYGQRPASEGEFGRAVGLADALWEEGSPSSGS